MTDLVDTLRRSVADRHAIEREVGRGGMLDDAIGCLDKAVANGFGHREWLLHDSDLDAIRGDQRFQTLLQKL